MQTSRSSSSRYFTGGTRTGPLISWWRMIRCVTATADFCTTRSTRTDCAGKPTGSLLPPAQSLHLRADRHIVLVQPDRQGPYKRSRKRKRRGKRRKLRFVPRGRGGIWHGTGSDHPWGQLTEHPGEANRGTRGQCQPTTIQHRKATVQPSGCPAMRCCMVTGQCRGVARAANTRGRRRVGTTPPGAPTWTTGRDALRARDKCKCVVFCFKCFVSSPTSRKWTNVFTLVLQAEEESLRLIQGMQQVPDLVDFLVTLRTCRTLTTAQQDTLIDPGRGVPMNFNQVIHVIYYHFENTRVVLPDTLFKRNVSCIYIWKFSNFREMRFWSSQEKM